jgi:hypothetical protein
VTPSIFGGCFFPEIPFLFSFSLLPWEFEFEVASIVSSLECPSPHRSMVGFQELSLNFEEAAVEVASIA